MIELLLEIQWWNWDIKKIEENVDALIDSDVGKLKEIKSLISKNF